MLFAAHFGYEFLLDTRGLGGTERHRRGPRHRVHHLLRKPHRRGPLHVRTHVHVLWVRPAAVAGQRWRPVSPVPGHHQGRHTHLQVVNESKLLPKLLNSASTASKKTERRTLLFLFLWMCLPYRIFVIALVFCFIFTDNQRAIGISVSRKLVICCMWIVTIYKKVMDTCIFTKVKT